MIKKNNALWGIIFFFFLVLAPIFLQVPDPWLKILMSIGTSVFVALTVAYFLNKKVKESTAFEVEELLNKHFPKLLKYDRLGLSDVVYQNNLESLEIDIVDEPNLYIVMNDGKNFFTNNAKKLSERFKQKNRKTCVVLLNDKSDSERILTKRNKKKEEGYYSRKIRESINDFLSFYKEHDETNVLEIYKYDFYFTMSIVATDSLALIGLYRNASGKDIIPPHFVFRNNGEKSEYANILNDILKLRNDSTLVNNDEFA